MAALLLLRSEYSAATRGWFGSFIFCALGLALAAYYFSPFLWLTAVGAFAFVAFSWLRLDVGLLYVVLSIPFYRFPKQLDPASLGIAELVNREAPFEFSLSEFTILACFLAWLLGMTLGHPAIRVKREWVRLFLDPAMLFLAAATISLAASEYLRFSLREYRTVVVEPLLFYLMLVTTIKSKEQVWRFAEVFILLGLAVALVSLYHYFIVGVVEETDGVQRALAIYHSPNALALFLGRIAPLTITLALFRTANKDWWRFLLYTSSSILVLIVLYLTYSRGAWFGLASALVFVIAMRNWRRLLIFIPAVPVALAAFSAITPWGRFVSSATVQQRLYLWQAAVDMIKAHPFFGVGLDNFLYQYPKYMLREAWAEPNISHPHNLFLDFWSRIGILGVVTLIWLQVNFWRVGVRLYRGLVGQKEQVLALALMASMVDFLVHGLIDNSLFLVDLALVFWLTFGLIRALESLPIAKAANPEINMIEHPFQSTEVT